MPLCGTLDEALRAEHAFGQALERTRLAPTPENATALVAATDVVHAARQHAQEGLGRYRNLRELILPRFGAPNLRETLEALRDASPDHLPLDDMQERLRTAHVEARNELLAEVLALLTRRGVLAPPHAASPMTTPVGEHTR